MQHVCEEDRIALCRPHIPRALPNGDRADVSLLVDPGAGLVVDAQHIAFGHRDVDGTGACVAVQGGHHVGKICQQAEFLQGCRIFGHTARLTHKLQGDFPVHRGIRESKGARRVELGRLEQGFRAVGQNLYRGGQLRKEIIRQHCRHLGLGDKRVGHNRVHCSAGDLGDGFFLPLICLPGECFQARSLIEDHRGIRCHQQKNGNQNKIEDFLLNASDYQILVFLHKDSFSAPVSPSCSFQMFLRTGIGLFIQYSRIFPLIQFPFSPGVKGPSPRPGGSSQISVRTRMTPSSAAMSTAAFV